jgi:UDP-glucose 4-epimerase
MKNILITGASGFIGQYFVQNYDDKYTIKKFSFLNDDFDLLELEGIDTIIHLSALVHQMGGAHKEEYEKVNVIQTMALAEKAKECGVQQFIFMSTVKVYGEETDIQYNEESPCLPQDAYGESKLKAEQILQKMSNGNFMVSIIRTPIVYGAGVKANIKNLIKLVDKVPILPFGDIDNKRSMLYVGNLAHLIDELIRQEKRGIFLASDDECYSTRELILLISRVLNKKRYLIKVPFFKKILKSLKPTFYKRLYESLEVDNNKSKHNLNLHNIYSTKEGLFLTIQKK